MIKNRSTFQILFSFNGSIGHMQMNTWKDKFDDHQIAKPWPIVWEIYIEKKFSYIKTFISRNYITVTINDINIMKEILKLNDKINLLFIIKTSSQLYWRSSALFFSYVLSLFFLFTYFSKQTNKNIVWRYEIHIPVEFINV